MFNVNICIKKVQAFVDILFPVEVQLRERRGEGGREGGRERGRRGGREEGRERRREGERERGRERGREGEIQSCCKY